MSGHSFWESATPLFMRILATGIVAFLAATGPGCMQRILRLRSEPPGAIAYVDGEEVGRTPCDHSFTFYGTVGITLRASGYLSHRELKTLSPPWYQFFPLDAVTDFLPLNNVETVEARLEPTPTEVDPQARKDLQDKAGEMRVLLESGNPPGG